ncbi:hypothetical protein DRO35_05350 [Candidatus Bathyarchaeota archaeon]|nr:MAG: hypothetical protein DRO35_05350 [Candidatus Bathyarchaeota archaeon]
MSSEEKGRASYLDLLINTLMEHEKNLNAIVEKLEKVSKDLREVVERLEVKTHETSMKESIIEERKKKHEPPERDTLTYIKLKLGRSAEDIIKIIESLKKEE